LLLLFLWVFDFCWVGLVFWDFDCFHNVCGVEKCKKIMGFASICVLGYLIGEKIHGVSLFVFFCFCVFH